MPDTDLNKQKGTGQLRAQAEVLLSQAQSQLAEIQRALGAVVGDSALQSRLAAVAAQMSGAAGTLSVMLNSPAGMLRREDLIALQSAVQSNEAATLLTEAAAQTTASAAIAQSLAASSAVTRQEVQTLAHGLFDRHIFDAYLHFDSAEDEAEYRKREAEARRYIEAQLARCTPEGNLNAAGGMQGQMLDAHAHGAGDSPEFLPRWKSLTEKAQQQRAVMRAAGQSTEEYDRNLTASVRRFLKAKGLSEAEINAYLAATANPLEAAKPFLEKDHASRNLEKTTKAIAIAAHTAPSALPAVETTEAAPVADSPIPANFDPFTKLKSAGVQVTDTTDSGHGLTAQKPASRSGPDRAS